MSSVSGIGGKTQGIYQFLQSMAGNSAAQSAGATTATSSSTSPLQSIAQAAQSIGQAIGSSRHHRGGALKQIQDAVTSALQSAQSSGSTSDPNKIVEDAIAQVLGNNNSAVSSAAGDGDGDGSNASTSPAINTQNFMQTLQSFGVSPQQFQQDLLSAVRDAQSGTVNPSTAFQNFPIGSTLNAVG